MNLFSIFKKHRVWAIIQLAVIPMSCYVFHRFESLKSLNNIILPKIQ